MFPCLTCTWLALFLPLFTEAADAATVSDLKRMKGPWSTDSFGGTPTTFTFDDRILKVEAEGVRYVISVSLDENAKPDKTIDMKIEESTTAGAVGKTSRGIYKFLDDDKLTVCFRAQRERPERYETVGFEQWIVQLRRIANPDKQAKDDKSPNVEPAAADSDAPLPNGWPAATKPGAIEVKSYPKYRSAVMRNRRGNLNDDNRLFFSLLNHISNKKIAMTAPVVMTYEPQVIEHLGEKGEISMEFLYQRPDQGEVGPGVGKVVVEDHPAVTVVALGVQGGMEDERMRKSVAELRAWLERHEQEWTAAGPPRRLGYHGPMTPRARQLNEVQIPVRPVNKQEK